MNELMKKSIGTAAKRWRIERRMSQNDMAAELGCSRSMVSQFERGFSISGDIFGSLIWNGLPYEYITEEMNKNESDC